MAKALLLVAMSCTLACATGRELGPNPAFYAAPESCSRVGAAWEQHWIETLDQLTTGELLEPAPELRSNWALRVVRLPFAVSTDVVTLAGFGVAGALTQVPVHTAEDVRPPTCPDAPSRSGAVTMGRPERD